MVKSAFETEILLSTYEDRVWDVLERVKKWASVSHVLIVHQTQDSRLIHSVSQQVSKISNVRYIAQGEHGVTKSRNLALENAQANILLFCDDDVELLDDFQNILVESFNLNPQVSAITFSVKDLGSEGLTKNFSDQPFFHNRLSILKVGTIEVAVRRTSLFRSNAKFPEDLGAGALLPVCDEPVFLSRLLAANQSVKYIPISIVAHKKESSGLKIDTYHKLKSRMVCFNYIFGGCLGRVMFVAFSIKNARKIKEMLWVLGCLFGR